MNKKYTYFFIFLLTGAVTALFFRETYLSPSLSIPVVFRENYRPSIEVTIGEKKQLLDLSLGSKYPLWLMQSSLQNMKTVQKGEGSWRGADGKEHSAPLVFTPSIQIGKLKLNQVPTIVASKSQMVVWPLKQANLLLDFPHLQIVHIRDLKELKQMGYNLKKMEKIPCKITSQGILLKGNTSIGELDLSLMTSASMNLIRKSFHKEKLKTFVQLGNKKIANLEMIPTTLPSELQMNGILGANFLKQHVIYIDGKEECIYLGNHCSNEIENQGITKIPVQFTKGGSPVISIKIQGKTYPTVVDTGSVQELVFSTSKIDHTKFRYLQNVVTVNSEGVESIFDTYLLPFCQIGDATLRHLSLHKGRHAPLNTSIYIKSAGTLNLTDQGYLGCSLLERTNIFFDFPHSLLYFLSNEEKLKKIGINLKEYHSIPFDIINGLIMLKIECSLGELTFCLDTGSEFSFVKQELVKKELTFKDKRGNLLVPSSFFKLNNQDMGKQELHLFPLSEKFYCDGFLGMDFLRKYPFYIDYPNQKIYIKINL